MLSENNLYIIVIYVVITVNHCKCMLLLYSPMNSYLGVGSWPSNRATEESNPKEPDYTLCTVDIGLFINIIIITIFYSCQETEQVGLGVGSWPCNRATEESNPKGARLYFVILLKNFEKIFDWH